MLCFSGIFQRTVGKWQEYRPRTAAEVKKSMHARWLDRATIRLCFVGWALSAVRLLCEHWQIQYRSPVPHASGVITTPYAPEVGLLVMVSSGC